MNDELTGIANELRDLADEPQADIEQWIRSELRRLADRLEALYV